MSEAEPTDSTQAQNTRVRRRVRKRKPAGARTRRRLAEREVQWQRALWCIVAFAAVALVGRNVVSVEAQSRRVGDFVIGMSQDHVRYQFGAPASIEDGGRLWHYRPQGADLALRFGAGRTLEAVTCEDLRVDQVGCPALFSLAPGSSEGDVLASLGPPDSAAIEGDTKRLTYAGPGLSLRLRQMEVISTTSGSRGGLAARLRIALWRSLP